MAQAGRRVLLVDQEPEQNLGGQAFWSFGGLLLVDSPVQRRLGIRDSKELAFSDWMATAGFDREEDHWPRRWAEAYLDFAAGDKRDWLYQRGVRFFPVVGWAERGGYHGWGHGNSVPRFHVVWGTGPGLVEPFEQRVRQAEDRVTLLFRHRVDELVVDQGRVTGVRGRILEPSSVERGAPSSRVEVGDFELSAEAVVVASGGIGANHDLVRKHWPERLDGESVLPPSVLTSHGLGLIAMTLSCLDLLRHDLPSGSERGWLEALWLWGAVRVSEPLFSPRNRGSPSLSNENKPRELPL